MNGVYKSLKGKVQDTLHVGKAGSDTAAVDDADGATNLSRGIEELEQVLCGGLGKLREAVRRTEAKRAEEEVRAQRVIGELKANIATLEAKLRDTEQTIRKKDSSRQQIEETLKARVQELLDELKKKEEPAAARAKEINDLRAKLEAERKRSSELEAGCEKARAEAAANAKRADEAVVASRARIETVEAQLRERDEVTRRKEALIRDLEQRLTAKSEEFEKLVKQQQTVLAGRDAIISDLKSQLRLLTKGIGEMSSFFKQAQAFTVIERAENGAGSKPAGSAERRPSAAPLAEAAVAAERNGAPLKTEATAREPVARQVSAAHPVKAAEESKAAPKRAPRSTPLTDDEVLSPDVIERISEELAEAAGVMAPLAILIVREHVEALGETTERFPKASVPDLLDSVSRELLDEKRQVVFRKRLAQNVRIDR
jgi:hypothetical protein